LVPVSFFNLWKEKQTHNLRHSTLIRRRAELAGELGRNMVNFNSIESEFMNFMEMITMLGSADTAR
jgi:hypothetical protein